MQLALAGRWSLLGFLGFPDLGVDLDLIQRSRLQELPVSFSFLVFSSTFF